MLVGVRGFITSIDILKQKINLIGAVPLIFVQEAVAKINGNLYVFSATASGTKIRGTAIALPLDSLLLLGVSPKPAFRPSRGRA